MKTCKKCGKESEDRAVFCKYCGNPFGETQEERADARGGQEKRRFLIPVVVGGVLLAAVAGGGFLVLRRSAGEAGAETETEAVMAESGGDKAAEVLSGLEGLEELLDLSQAKLADNYELTEEMGLINLGARNHQPGARDLSARWSKDLFYWLEDVGEGDDNHIADSILTRMELTESESGRPISYEVYRDPDTEKIQKIVSIDTLEDGSLELSDYYYLDGKPDFVFRRSDTIYTPSYATINKTGERYYFSGDQMVKWRWIYEPSVVKQWILELEDTWYTQWSYGEISDGERAQYDEKEIQVLNEAYNTYDAVTANDPKAVLQGCVVDEEGRPLEHVEVGIGTIAGGEARTPQVKVETDGNGNYSWLAEEDEEAEEYFLVFCKEGYIPSMMKVADMGSRYQTLHTVQEDMVLLREESDDRHTVTFCVYRVEAQSEEQVLARAFAEGETEETVPPLSGAKIRVYAGVNWFGGNPAAEEESSGDGTASAKLRDGIYTAVIEQEGCVPVRNVFQVNGKDSEKAVYLMGESGETEGEWKILLSWNASEESPLDLDSSLFTPDKAARGDRNCINTLNRSDGEGAEFLYDGEGRNACEVITLSVPRRGSYKYYVSNYTGIQSGEPGSFAEAGARVTLFHNGVPVRTFSAPKENGTVWEVFELRDQGIVPIQEVYESAEGKDWWTENKTLARLSERQTKPEWIQSDGEWLYFVNPADNGRLYYCRKDGSGLTKFSDDWTADGKILLVDDFVYYIAVHNGNYTGYTGQDIIRIKNDGTERTVVQEDIKLDGVGEYGSCITGYAEGMLYYYNPYGGNSVIPIDGSSPDTSIWTLSGEELDGNYPHYRYGQNAGRAAVVGNYIYYVEEGDSGRSFWRKSLESGREECLQPQISWDPWLWGIYRGWLYCTEGGLLKRIRFIGPGSFEEEQILADNVINIFPWWWPGEETQYSFTFYDDTCFYPGNDGNIYALSLDGSGGRTRSFDGSLAEGEFYVQSGVKGSSIEVCDKNGENRRLVVDGSPLINQAAMAAYAQRLGENDNIDFACVDIDGDGINELFVSTFWNYGMEYCRYNGWYIETMPDVLDGILQHQIAFNRDAQEIVTAEYNRLARYKYDGTQIDYMEFERDWDSESPKSLAADAEFESMKAIYFDPYPNLNFVENTMENRQKYLIDGTGTGWVSH